MAHPELRTKVIDGAEAKFYEVDGRAIPVSDGAADAIEVIEDPVAKRQAILALLDEADNDPGGVELSEDRTENETDREEQTGQR